MFDHLVCENALEPAMKEHGLVLPVDLVFIKEQIAGPQNTVPLSQGVSQPASEPVSQSINQFKNHGGVGSFPTSDTNGNGDRPSGGSFGEEAQT